MGGLNLHVDDENSGASSEKKKWNKSPKLILGLAVLIAIPIIGTTFAGTITVNGGTTIDFGQGVQAAAACDSTLTITPYASFRSSGWYLESVTVTNLDTTDSTKCLNKNLTVQAYNGSGATLTGSATTFQPSSSTTDTVTVHSTWSVGTNDSVAQTSGGGASTVVTITYTSGVLLSSYDVQGFAIQQN
jgi:hypothetical protein